MWDYIIMIMEVIGAIISILGFAQIYDYYKNKVSFIKRADYWVCNKGYKIQLTGRKKYSMFKPNMKELKKRIINKYKYINDSNLGENWISVLIGDMQAPYKIVIMEEPDINNFSAPSTECMVLITLGGSVNFKYRDSFENKKFINVMDELFKIIEQMEDRVPKYENYLLKATTDDSFKREPFISDIKMEECEDTKVEAKKKVLRINSKSSNNLYKCLKKNISKVL